MADVDARAHAARCRRLEVGTDHVLRRRAGEGEQEASGGGRLAQRWRILQCGGGPGLLEGGEMGDTALAAVVVMSLLQEQPACLAHARAAADADARSRVGVGGYKPPAVVSLTASEDGVTGMAAKKCTVRILQRVCACVWQ